MVPKVRRVRDVTHVDDFANKVLGSKEAESNAIITGYEQAIFQSGRSAYWYFAITVVLPGCLDDKSLRKKLTAFFPDRRPGYIYMGLDGSTIVVSEKWYQRYRH